MLGAGRAARAISSAAGAAEHGVLDAASNGTNAINSTLNNNSNALIGAQNQAIGDVSQYGNYAINNQNQNLGTATGSLAPFIGAGQSGVNALQSYALSNPQFNFAPTQQQLEQTPGYQFQLQQGLNAAQNANAAKGLGNSSNATMDATKYAEGLAGTYYQNAFNNALNTFQTNQGTTLANLGALTSAGLTGTGQQNQALIGIGNPAGQYAYETGLFGGNAILNTAGMNAQQALQGTEYGAGLTANAANSAGNFAMQGAGANAAGILGQANNLSGIITGAAPLLGPGLNALGSLIGGYGSPSQGGWMPGMG
jgi:hypothetical protein